MKLILVAAINRQNVLSINDKIPWHNKEDMENFRKLTRGHIVVMGRNTYESIGKPLVDRVNLVVTNNYLKTKSNVYTVTVQDVLQNNYGVDLFIIGGASIYKQFAEHIDRMYLTVIDDHTDSSSALYFPWEAFEGTSWIVSEQRRWEGATYLVMDKA